MTEAVHSTMDGGCASPIDALLPWFLTGTLDEADRLSVEAHLAACSLCRSALNEERALMEAVIDLPLESSVAWTRFKQTRLEVPRRSVRRWVHDNVVKRPGRAVGLAAMQAAVVLFVLNVAPSTLAPTDDYRVLSGASSNATVGNAVIVFQPSTTEADLRRLLVASKATIVTGPTATDGYILRLPAAERASQIKALRRQPAVVLIEAIDGPAT